MKGYFEKEILVFIGFKRWKGDLYYFVFYYFWFFSFSNSAIFQLEGEVIRLEGIPGVAIISKAREVNASMIVIGSRGFGRIRRTLMGSVSNFVVHHSPVPVALCKYEKRATEVP